MAQVGVGPVHTEVQGLAGVLMGGAGQGGVVDQHGHLLGGRVVVIVRADGVVVQRFSVVLLQPFLDGGRSLEFSNGWS